MGVRTARWIGAVVLAVLTVVTLAVLVAPRVFGWQSYVVTSGSMEPTFDPGAVVLVQPVEAADVRVGDIITYRSRDGLTTHRVSTKTQSVEGETTSFSFTTQGDANNAPDPGVLPGHDVVGQARFAVPHLGYVVSFVSSPLGAGVLTALFLFVLFGGGRRDDDAPEELQAERPALQVVAS